MRLKSSIFVSAVIRRETADGAFAAVLAKGSQEAGAIFVIHQKSRNRADMYGPAPQNFLDDGHVADRSFECISEDLDDEAIRGKMETQKRFDPDCWIIEIEKSKPLISIEVINTDQL